MRVGTEQFEDGVGPHLTEGEMIEYRRGVLAEADREFIKYHLIQCDACLAAFRTVVRFFDSPRENENLASEADVSRELQLFWGRIQSEEPVRRPVPGGGLRRRLIPWAWGVVTAGLLIGLVLLAIWAMDLRRDQKELEARLQDLAGQSRSEKEELTRQVTELKEENLALQKQNVPATKQDEAVRARADRPELNAPIYSIYSRDSVKRSGQGGEVNRVVVPADGGTMILVLNGEGQSDYANYTVDIQNRKAQVVWRGQGLKRNAYRNFVIVLSNRFLSQGTYKLNLYGQSGRGKEIVAEYVIAVE